ncbi:hypothetical protein M9458_022296, partial [Cirrhinus mrigala]
GSVRNNVCLGGSGWFFPGIMPELRRDLLVSGAVWSNAGPAGGVVPGAGA